MSKDIVKSFRGLLFDSPCISHLRNSATDYRVPTNSNPLLFIVPNMEMSAAVCSGGASSEDSLGPGKVLKMSSEV